MSGDDSAASPTKPSPTKMAWATKEEGSPLDALRSIAASTPAEPREQLKRGLARMNRTHPAAIDFLKGMGAEDFTSFMTDFTEYLESDASKKDFTMDWESMGMVQDVRLLSEERRKEMEALEALVKTLEVGMRVQRRYKGREWGEGYVTELEPLRVTLSNTDPNAEGYKWAEVRHIPEERIAELAAADAKKKSEEAAFKRLVSSLSVGMRVERCDDSGRWAEGFVTSLEPLKVTNSASDPSGWSMEWAEVRPLSAERQAELAAEQAEKNALISQLEIGMRVERRYDNSEWGEGFVTSLDPLEVTVSSMDPKSEGYRWAEVRVLPPEKMAKYREHKALLTQLSVGMRVERRYESAEWGEGFVTCLEPLEITLSDKEPQSEAYKWSEVRLLSEERLQELRAADELLKQLSIGMRVERRYKGGEWGEGFVTCLAPLKVSMTCNDKQNGGVMIGSNDGYEWHEVRLITPERAKELEAMKEAIPPLKSNFDSLLASSGLPSSSVDDTAAAAASALAAVEDAAAAVESK